MSLFGSSNRPAFKPTPYGYTRRSKGIPRWLVLLLTGIALGAGGVLFLQRSYGPQRLTVEQSDQLRMDLNTANLDKQRLLNETKQLKASLDQTTQTASQQAEQITRMKHDHAELESGIGSLIEAIPADPRGTSPGIRSVDMVGATGQLNYRILLIQDSTDGDTPAFDGQIKLVASGHYSNGKTVYVDLLSAPLHMTLYKELRGEAALPEGFRARQITIQITPEGSDKVAATRTVRVAAK